LADGPAARAGLVAGDRVCRIGGHAVRALEDVADALAGHPPGAALRLGVVCGHEPFAQPRTVVVHTAAAGEGASLAPAVPPPASPGPPAPPAAPAAEPVGRERSGAEAPMAPPRLAEPLSAQGLAPPAAPQPSPMPPPPSRPQAMSSPAPSAADIEAILLELRQLRRELRELSARLPRSPVPPTAAGRPPARRRPVDRR
jgi:hypothetical protein